MVQASDELCPCGTGLGYAVCCSVYHHGGQQAPTAEALMRSRYSAFVKGQWRYVQHTAARVIRSQFLTPADAMDWVGLKVLSVTAGGIMDTVGTVEFAAFFRQPGQLGVLHERSGFVREEGQWRYASGTQNPSGSAHLLTTLGRNAACPCGSGRKYKKCCGR